LDGVYSVVSQRVALRQNVDDHRVAGVIIASKHAPSATSVHHIVITRFREQRQRL